jgi:hypothetical protein
MISAAVAGGDIVAARQQQVAGNGEILPAAVIDGIEVGRTLSADVVRVVCPVAACYGGPVGGCQPVWGGGTGAGWTGWAAGWGFGWARVTAAGGRGGGGSGLTETRGSVMIAGSHSTGVSSTPELGVVVSSRA